MRLLAPFLILLFSCRTVPYTGRSQLVLFPVSVEENLGEETYKEILKKEKVSKDKNLIEKVERVGKKMILSAGLGKEWEFTVIENDKVINAFALPGKKICVYTGLLDLGVSDDELAAVIGHELAHITARHGGERMSQLLLAEMGGIALSLAMRKKRAETIQLAQVAYGAVVGLGVLLPYSRKHEEEADYIGLVYMKKAGFNLSSALSFWEKMEKSSGPSPPEFLSTHPSHKTRIKNIGSWIPEINKKY